MRRLRAIMTVIFPPMSNAGVRIVVKNVGGVSGRLFVWDLSQAR